MWGTVTYACAGSIMFLQFLRLVVMTNLPIAFQRRDSRSSWKRTDEFFGCLHMVCKQCLSTLACSDKWRYPPSLWPSGFSLFVQYIPFSTPCSVLTMLLLSYLASLLLFPPLKFSFLNCTASFKVLPFKLEIPLHVWEIFQGTPQVSFPIHDCHENCYVLYEGCTRLCCTPCRTFQSSVVWSMCLKRPSQVINWGQDRKWGRPLQRQEDVKWI